MGVIRGCKKLIILVGYLLLCINVSQISCTFLVFFIHVHGMISLFRYSPGFWLGKNHRTFLAFIDAFIEQSSYPCHLVYNYVIKNFSLILDFYWHRPKMCSKMCHSIFLVNLCEQVHPALSISTDISIYLYIYIVLGRHVHV